MRNVSLGVLLALLTACAHERGHPVACPVRGELGPASGYFGELYEDYVLSYVFADVEHGSYIDVGANDPDRGNVTKRFYLAGWRGINIEPNPEVFAVLDRARPGDVNLNVGIADQRGHLTFYRFRDSSGLSTFDRDIAERHHRERGLVYEELDVAVMTLDDVLAEHAAGGRSISFMSVDVEGYERHVLASVDLAKHPIAVIMVEANAPMTQVASYRDWEPLLTSAGYLFAMSDGLNRYYVSPARRDLLPRFAAINRCVELDKTAKHIPLGSYR